MTKKDIFKELCKAYWTLVSSDPYLYEGNKAARWRLAEVIAKIAVDLNFTSEELFEDTAVPCLVITIFKAIKNPNLINDEIAHQMVNGA